MSELIPQNFGQVSTRFANTAPVDDLSSGIQSSFGLVGYKGKVWSIRYRGEDRQLMRDDGDGPRGSIEVVILKASSQISKIWYEAGYVEGSNAAPDCFSNNGIAPEPTSQKRQCDSCALCPHNQWGSRITPAGKAGKACADSKRLAVVPLNDLRNEMFGGPLLLRVPAASLQDLAMYGQKMQQMGYPYYSIGTKIAFDPAESYPKFLLSGLRPLTDQEADIVLVERDGHTVNRILSESEFTGPIAGGAPAHQEPLFEQAPAVGARVASVGDQARAAAAQQAQARQEPVKTAPQPVQPVQEAAASAQSTGFGASAAPVTTKVIEAEVEAADDEGDDDRELRELAAKVAEAKARKAAAAKAAKAAAEAETKNAASNSNAQAQPTTTAQSQAEPVAQPSEDGNMASAFENDLDSMLANLLP